MDAMDAEAGFAELKAKCVERAQQLLTSYEDAGDAEAALAAVAASFPEARLRLVEAHATIIAASVFLSRAVGEDVKDNPFKDAAQEATANFLTAAEMLEATRLAVAHTV